MYKEIAETYKYRKNLDYETLNRCFNLEKRTMLDLKNLHEFVAVFTLIQAQRVLIAQNKKNNAKVKKEIKRYESSCQLLTILIDAIDSNLYK